MRTRTPAALAIVGALALAACGSDDNSADDAAASPATTEAMAEDEMSEDEMSDDEMSDDEMSDDEMTETTDDMSDDEMSDDEMSDDMSDEEMAAAEGDLVVVASGRDDLTTLVAAIEAAGLTAALTGEGPFTIFAPNDEAFEDYLGEMGMTAEDALADTVFLSTLLQGHVVEAGDDSAMVAGMVDNPFVSLAGTELPVTVDGDTITIGGAEIVEADIFATNGVIHVIDTVLAPA
ncbi:MAG TPA: fasciclin domain-containing protein [Ilumatobacteraceae bacterium]|nr:fasciclin domain-containing protein [Ilumatobacteraceae bacterium]